MKKFFLSILVLIYFAVSSGIAMEIHYCMGERAGVDFFREGSSKCGKCGMKEQKGGCCSDEHQFYKLSDAHKHISNNLEFGTVIPDHVIPGLFSINIPHYPKVKLLSSSLSPPGRTVPIYIFKNVFRL